MFIIIFILIMFFTSYTNYTYDSLNELKGKVKSLGVNNKAKINKK